MGYYQSGANAFTDKRSNYVKTIDNCGNIHISGNIYINNVVMRYSANQQKKGYLIRGRISIISPVDGNILQMSGKNRRNALLRFQEKDKVILKKNNRHEMLDCRSEFVVNILDDEKIKERITSSALKLYSKHEATILRAFKDLGIIAKHDATTALTIHIQSFINRLYSKNSVQNQKSVEKKIQKVTAFFGTVPMGDITRAMIKAYHKQHENSAGSDLNYARKFWEYCREKGVYTGENPLETHAEVYCKRKQKNGIEAIRKSIEPINIQFDVEQKLNKEIIENIADGSYIGLLLIKECGFETKVSCELKWKDVNLCHNYITIHIQKDSLSGATHDYTRPLTPFAEDVLYQRYFLLRKKYSKEEILKMPIASKATDLRKPLKSKELTNLCRNALIRAGLDQSKLSVVPVINMGAGVRLLHKNIRYRLEHYCGLFDDPAAVSFLMGNSLQSDVTADHYRSFISDEGQAYLYNALKRDKRFINNLETEENKDNMVTSWSMPGGITEYSISPSSPHDIITFKIKVQIKPNDCIYLYAPQGISCTVKVLKV